MLHDGVTLLLGGARSGKSRRALELAAHAEDVCYIATARENADDLEWAQRIARHRRERPAHWQTLEVPLALDQALASLSISTLVIIDCMTLWLTNIMLAEKNVHTESERVMQALADFRGSAILISNETGMGIVPEYPLGREFRDAQGRLNQKLAAMADDVELMVAGLPLVLK